MNNVDINERFKYDCWADISSIQHKLDKLCWRIENVEVFDGSALDVFDKSILNIIIDLQMLSTKIHYKTNSVVKVGETNV